MFRKKKQQRMEGTMYSTFCIQMILMKKTLQITTHKHTHTLADETDEYRSV